MSLLIPESSGKMILCSVITYELAKRLGQKGAQEEFHKQALTTLDTPNEKVLPAAMVVRRLRKFSEVALLHDAGGTSIGHARARAFSVAERGARNGKIDVWISCDDDMQASQETLNHLVRSIDPDEPQIIIVPAWLRQDTPIVNVTLDNHAPLSRVSASGARLRRALYGGFGIVAMSRAALVELGQMYRDLTFVDDDAVERIGIFCEFIREGWWFREDYAFFSRVPAHVRIEALLTGISDHAGKVLRLETVEQHDHIPMPQPFQRRDTEPPPAPADDEPEAIGPTCGVCRTPYALVFRQACQCYVQPEQLCQHCATVPCTCERCGQEGGYVGPEGHSNGVCDYRLGHEGAHSWEPDDVVEHSVSRDGGLTWDPPLE